MVSYLDQLDALYGETSDDTRLMRLHPPAYSVHHEDGAKDGHERNVEWESFMRDELTQSRRAALHSARTLLLSDEPVDEATLHGFAMTLNSLRLVLGTVLGIDSDDDIAEDELDDEPNDARAAQIALYEFCGWLLEWTVDALAGDLNDD